MFIQFKKKKRKEKGHLLHFCSYLYGKHEISWLKWSPNNHLIGFISAGGNTAKDSSKASAPEQGCPNLHLNPPSWTSHC